eukprot:5800081-Pyramimonas_sp.AAC.1
MSQLLPSRMMAYFASNPSCIYFWSYVHLEDNRPNTGTTETKILEGPLRRLGSAEGGAPSTPEFSRACMTKFMGQPAVRLLR